MFHDLLAERLGTTVDAERFSYIYFEEKNRKDDHQFGLAWFDNRSGKEVGWLWLNCRNSELAVDPVTQTVFFKSSEKVIQALWMNDN